MINIQGLFVAIILIITYLFTLKSLTKQKYLKFSLVFLLITPWFIQLLFSGFEPFWLKPLTSNPTKIIQNFITNTSSDYLFFRGDPRIKFGTQETGPFYIFQIPLILIGFYSLAKKNRKWGKILLGWLLGALVFASLFISSPDFSNDLFYFLPLEIISFLGFLSIIENWYPVKMINRFLISIFLILTLYEIGIFWHILFIHYPKRLII